MGRFVVIVGMLGGAAALAGCAETPEYAVRPGAPRAAFEVPKPAYPVRTDAAPAAPAPPPAAAKTSAGDDAPSPFKPVPIDTRAPEPRDSSVLRGRQSPGPAMPVRSAPTPALETPRQAVVRPDESLFELAERLRTPVRAIIDANGLQPPYDVTPGQTLKIPPPVVYVVKAGDTLASVGHRFSIEPRSLASLNDLALEAPLKPGQRLALPALVKDREATPKPVATAAPSKPGPGLPKPIKPAVVASIIPPPPTPELTPKPAPEETGAAAPIAAGKGKFTWPVRGDILSSFGPKGPGQRNDGINIAATDGEPVHAAAAGTVVYAGNSVPGFGNLVVIKHPNGWTSLYGNLGKMAVKIRAEVAQGEVLGVAGQSGAVDRPQLHFEVRYAASPQEKARPVDPQTLLP